MRIVREPPGNDEPVLRSLVVFRVWSASRFFADHVGDPNLRSGNEQPVQRLRADQAEQRKWRGVRNQDPRTSHTVEQVAHALLA